MWLSRTGTIKKANSKTNFEGKGNDNINVAILKSLHWQDFLVTANIAANSADTKANHETNLKAYTPADEQVSNNSTNYT